MARIYGPIELLDKETHKGTGLYHYGVYSDEEHWAHPLGACANNCPGHKTTEEAYDHYYTELVKTAPIRFRKDNECQHKCKICGKWTNNIALVDVEFYEEFMLCDEHNNEANVRKLYAELVLKD